MASIVLQNGVGGSTTLQEDAVTVTNNVLTLPTVSGTLFVASTGGGPLAINQGGTGATTQSGAQTALGVPAANGTGASGTWAINITGNAATATTATSSSNGNPTGTIIMWPTTTAPTGYVLCNGAAISRTTYAALFAVISTTFGAGDGSTTFNTPNYVNRMPYGTTIAATGGSTDAIVVAHTHTASLTGSANTSSAFTGVYDSGHAHNLSFSNYLSGTAGGSGTGQFTPPQLQTEVATASLVDPGHYHSVTVTTSGTTASTGASGTGANLPPYLGINFIIKT